MKKPSIPDSYPPSREHMNAIKENIEAVTGRRGTKCDLVGLQNMSISDPPTQAEVLKLWQELVKLVVRLES